MAAPLDHELRTAIALAQAAGELVVAIRKQGIEVDYKLGEEPVTRADREASGHIVAGLLAAFPADVVVSEDVEVDPARTSASRVWYVDPIDGTRDFIRGDDGFAVMIGLCVEGAPVLGVVHQPTAARTFFTAPTVPAQVQHAEGGALPLRVSATDDPAKCRLAASASHRSADIDRVKDLLGIRDELNVGSVGLKLCLIALGARDLYINPAAKTKAWDTCAPEAILRAAGGTLSDLYGVPIDYRAADLRHLHGLVASNGIVHDDVTRKLAQLFPRSPQR